MGYQLGASLLNTLIALIKWPFITLGTALDKLLPECLHFTKITWRDRIMLSAIAFTITNLVRAILNELILASCGHLALTAILTYYYFSQYQQLKTFQESNDELKASIYNLNETSEKIAKTAKKTQETLENTLRDKEAALEREEKLVKEQAVQLDATKATNAELTHTTETLGLQVEKLKEVEKALEEAKIRLGERSEEEIAKNQEIHDKLIADTVRLEMTTAALEMTTEELDEKTASLDGITAKQEQLTIDYEEQLMKLKTTTEELLVAAQTLGITKQALTDSNPVEAIKKFLAEKAKGAN